MCEQESQLVLTVFPPYCQGPPGATGKLGLPVSTRLSRYIKHTHRRTRNMALIVFAAPCQGAPGPKGEPGEGLNEVWKQCLSLFFLLASFEKQPEGNKTVLSVQGEAVQQLREALKILAERVLILEHMIGVHGEEKLDYAKKGLLTFC